jgi:nitroreductase
MHLGCGALLSFKKTKQTREVSIMEIVEAIRSRRSIRNYQDRTVEQEKLIRVLEAGRRAPSARNLQDWKFIVVKDKEKRQKLSEAAKGQAFVAQAPVVIAACGTQTEYIMTCGQYCYPIDVAIAIDHMSLMATAEGLGTCWIGAFYEDKVKDILGIPEKIRVAVMLTLGYPAESPVARPRKKLEEIVAYDRW